MIQKAKLIFLGVLVSELHLPCIVCLENHHVPRSADQEVASACVQCLPQPESPHSQVSGLSGFSVIALQQIFDHPDT
jgi:hypothetical protein